MATDEARLKKFLQRADKALQGPVYDASPPPAHGFPLKLLVTITPDGNETTEIRWPDISEAEIVLAITRCRTFLLPGEDNYLPKVLASMRRLYADPRWGKLHSALDQDVAATLDGKDLRQNIMYSGSWEGDHPPAMSEMIGDADLSMHYIYGEVLHEDEWRRQELAKHGLDSHATKLAVIVQMNLVMKRVHVMRHIIRRMERSQFPT
ncbi:hypothetical protein [Arthrobacter humicola]